MQAWAGNGSTRGFGSSLVVVHPWTQEVGMQVLSLGLEGVFRHSPLRTEGLASEGWHVT
jgi:hypothetical protein